VLTDGVFVWRRFRAPVLADAVFGAGLVVFAFLLGVGVMGETVFGWPDGASVFPILGGLVVAVFGCLVSERITDGARREAYAVWLEPILAADLPGDVREALRSFRDVQLS